MIRLALIAWLALCGVANAQLSGGLQFPGPGMAHSSGSGCADANVIAWKAAVVTAGGTVSGGQETNVCTLVAALKAHSLWTIQDRIWLYASENAQQASIDIVNLATHTLVNAPTFVANQGYTGNGSTSYINTGFANGTNYTQNSAAWSYYVRTNRTGSNNYFSGSYDAGSFGTQSLFAPLASSIVNYDVNNVAFSNQAANTQAQGFWTASRTGASAVALYRNSNSTAFATSSSSSLSLGANVVFFVNARNNNGSPDLFGADEIAIVAYGAGMSNTNTAQFQADLNAYMTALGTNVY